MVHESIVFCDFDGTITTEETFIGALTRICDKNDLHYWADKLINKKAPLGECWENLFQTVPSDRFGRIIEYAKTINIRKGFNEFLHFLKQRNIPIIVISGGIGAMQEIVLKPYLQLIEGYYACDLDISGPRMKFSSKFSDESENMNKLAVMELYKYRQCICIGDNITDIRMSEKADILFARDKLEEHCIASNKPYFEWNDFYDITTILEDILS